MAVRNNLWVKTFLFWLSWPVLAVVALWAFEWATTVSEPTPVTRTIAAAAITSLLAIPLVLSVIAGLWFYRKGKNPPPG